MYDLEIAGGCIYQDGKWTSGNLFIKNGRIEQISSAHLEAKAVYDAAGASVIPGLIDSHVHLQAQNGRFTSADSFYSGTAAGALGGVTTVIDFLDEACDAGEAVRNFELRMSLAKDSAVDYAFHCGVRQPKNVPELAKAMLERGIPSFKVYTTYKQAGIFSDDLHIGELLKRTSDRDVMMLSHTENDDLIDWGLKRMEDYARRRPVICELSKAVQLAEMTDYYKGLTYMVHVSCGSTVQELNKRFGDILHRQFFLESCPHYFLFDDSVYSGKDATLYTMIPHLRSGSEREKLVGAFDEIDTVGTDHCPYTRAEKQNLDIDAIPMGVNGLGNSFLQMYRLFGDRVIDRFTRNQAQIHGLFPQKGILCEGADADIAIFEEIAPRPGFRLYGRSDYSIYSGCEENILIRTVLSRGEFVVKDGVLCPHQGKFVRRKLDFAQRNA